MSNLHLELCKADPLQCILLKVLYKQNGINFNNVFFYFYKNGN